MLKERQTNNAIRIKLVYFDSNVCKLCYEKLFFFLN